MLLTSRLQEALNLASRLHREQTRRDSGKTPYVSHLVSVMLLLTEVTSDEDVLIAGLLHDSLEDVKGFDKAQLEEAFGEKVANIVYHVTEPFNAGGEIDAQVPWLTRKEMYITRVQEGSYESALISCADKLHNITTLVEDYKKEGEIFLKGFHGSMQNQLLFYEKMIAMLKEKLPQDTVLLQKLAEKYKEAEVVFKSRE